MKRKQGAKDGAKRKQGGDDGQDGVRAKYAENRKKAVATENKPRLLRNTTVQYESTELDFCSPARQVRQDILCLPLAQACAARRFNFFLARQFWKPANHDSKLTGHLYFVLFPIPGHGPLSMPGWLFSSFFFVVVVVVCNSSTGV